MLIRALFIALLFGLSSPVHARTVVVYDIPQCRQLLEPLKALDCLNHFSRSRAPYVAEVPPADFSFASLPQWLIWAALFHAAIVAFTMIGVTNHPRLTAGQKAGWVLLALATGLVGFAIFLIAAPIDVADAARRPGSAPADDFAGREKPQASPST